MTEHRSPPQYPSPPFPLPETLPAGTMFGLTARGRWTTEAKLEEREGIFLYVGRCVCDGIEYPESCIHPGFVLWETVPVPVAKETAACLCCGRVASNFFSTYRGELFILNGKPHCDGCADLTLGVCAAMAHNRAGVYGAPVPAELLIASADCRRCGSVPCVCDNPVRATEKFCLTMGCLARGVPATHGEYRHLCVYCYHSSDEGRSGNIIADQAVRSWMDNEHCGGPGARARLAQMDRKERAPTTASSRELAAGHPSGWPSQYGED